MTFEREELLAIERLKRRVRQLESERSEPIAIVGASCRLPGCDDLAQLWTLLERGGDAITNLHASAGTPMPCGSIESLESFDAEFFRMSPREVARMDARQRLVLEASWEALEHAGIPATALDGVRAGVYVGASGIFALADGDAGAHDITGTLSAVIAGRVSYFLGLRGPCMSIDTACSSSLVALHVACKALRAGECSIALAGGVGVLGRSRREGESWLAVGHFARGGRCRTFDAQADGIVGSDGVAMVVLKRLSTAVHDGDHILALVRGSAINHDGRAQGLTVPSGIAQEDVIVRALAEARVEPHSVDYIECHGTGTPLGDPIEVQAIGNVFGAAGARSRPVLLGSIKSNLGHTDAAAGAVGIMKVVLALAHERIPRNIHFGTPNPYIAWDELPVKVVAEEVAWRRNGVRRIAGVSSFGISGTNAHVVIEEAPVAPSSASQGSVARAAELVVISGRTAAALDATALRLQHHLEALREQALGDVAYSLATSRSHHEHRLSLVVENREALTAALGAVARGERPAGSARGQVQRGKTAWLFSGQGSQVVGMGRALADGWPVFREALDAATEALDGYLAAPVRRVMWEGTEQALSQTAYTQPAVFAVETALAALWQSWGVEPDVVMGHSIGELAAAYVAGVFSLADAARLVVARGRLMQALPGGGAMWSIAAAESEVAAAVAGEADAVSIGAINGPASVVISGDEAAVARIAAQFAARGARTRRLEVSHAFHSARMEPMLAAFGEVAEAVTYRMPERLLVSNVTGGIAGPEVATAAYWVQHVRAAVRFADGVKALAAAGVTKYLELGPRPTLAGLVPACLGPEASPVVLASLRPDRSEPAAILEALGGHHAHGGAVDWSKVWPAGVRVELPTYAWQRQRYAIEDAGPARRAGESTEHPLLGVHVSLAGREMIYETVLSRREQGWLYDHRVAGQAVVPGAGLMELVRAAAEHRFEAAAEVVSLALLAPLVLPDRGGQRVQVVVSEDGARYEASVYSQPERGDGTGWRLHATAELRRAAAAQAVDRIDLAAVRSRCREAIVVSEIYDAFAATGLVHGPAFRGLQAVWRGPGEALAELALPAGSDVDEVGGYGVHPALLDAAFQATQALGAGMASELVLPFAMDRLVVHEPGARSALAYVRLSEPAAAGADRFSPISVDVTLTDLQGRVLVELNGLHGRRADAQAIRAADGVVSQARYRIDWHVAAAGSGRLPGGPWLVVGHSDDALVGALVAQLCAAGTPCTQVTPEALAGALPAARVVCVWGAPPDASADSAATAASDVEALRAQQIASEGLALVQCLAQQGTQTRVWLVTQGAVWVDGDRTTNVGQSTLWGLGRTVMQEHPELGCTLVDAPAGDAGEAASAVVRELGAGDDEREIAWRGGTRRVARLVRAAQDESAAWQAGDGAVLITGGLGALGMHVARWLAGRGVRHLVLTGRRGRQTPGAEAAIGELEGLGARVTVAAVDVADRAAMAGVVAEIGAGGALCGVVHAAGVLDDGVVGEQSAARFAGVLGPKLVGALHLDALTRGLALDFFVVFSSTAGTLGSAGQAPYAAASAGLDALAAGRRARGEAGQSLAWGAWSESGMAAQLSAMHQARIARQGIQAWTPAQGVAVLASVLGRPEPQLVLLPLDLSAARKALGANVPPVWRALVRPPRRAAARGGWADEIAALPAARRRAAIAEVVRQEIARVMALASETQVAEDRPLQDLGLDSLMAVELRNALGKRAGASLPATLAFDYPTPAAITGYLFDKVLSLGGAALTASAPSAPIERPADEPIAIVGLGCRYPGGVSDPASLWRLLEAGGDGVIDVPPERWDADALYDPDPDAPGKTTCRSGGFLLDIDQFDANFFGISPREATSVDPQQRLLLETSWEAIERAGIAPDRLVGSSTGVFVGLMYQEYAMRAVSGGLEQLDGYVGMGTAASVAAGRISYTLGLQGPCMTVDTACSSSLVTTHLACQALRQGECSLALAGGVAMMLMPTVFVEFSRLRGLSPDGRCKSFSAEANGVGWAEGCGMLVLERLSDAQRNGHPVLAVIRGSAVNQDGRSNGLTAPNGPSQEAVIRRALAQAGVRPADVQYVECHGTGTSLGDPIEVQALGAVLAEGREPDRPAWIGSIKSNLGHTQAAAGAAGIMKVVLALAHERIPRNIHFGTPNPHIAWDELPVTVVAQDMPWSRNGVRRIAGVSSFGVSGTNAHVVIEEAPVAHAAQTRAAETRGVELIAISGRSAAAVGANAERLAQHLEAHPEQALGDVAYSLATSRSHHEHRLSLVVENREALTAALGAVARGERPAGSARGQVQRGKTAWLFSGQGSQVVGMGRALADGWPVFREALDAATEALDGYLAAPVRRVMWEGTEQALSQTAYTQPAVFAVETALAALWQSWGVEPDVVMGHSIGELAAAYVAGVFSLADAARLVVARGRLMQALPGGGAMWSIAAAESEVAAAVAGEADAVSIGAINGPASVVISGDEAAVARIAAQFAARGARTRRLEVSHAFHSARMEPMLAAFGEVAEAVTYRMPERLLVSNVTGGIAGPEVATAAYWVQHVRAAVRFADGVKALAAAGVTKYLELGPRPTLAGLVPACLGPEASPVVLASLRPDRSEPAAILEALGGYHAVGGALDWAKLWPTGARIELPTYAWQRQRYWIEVTSAARRGGEPTEHPLLGVHVALAGTETVYETVLSRREHAWLYDHRVAGQPVVPGAALVELVRAAGEHRLEWPAEAVSLVLQAPLVLPERGGQRVQVALAEDGARLSASVYSQPEQSDGAGWRLHATAEVRPATGTRANAIDLAAIRSRCKAAIAVEKIYEDFAATGLVYGPAFRGLQAVWGGRGEALAELVLPDGFGGDEVGDYGVHPALLDAAFQATQALADGSASELVLPFAMDRLVVHEPGARRAFAFVRRSESGAGASVDRVSIDVTLADAHGRVLVELLGLHGRRADAQAIRGRATDGAVAQTRYRIDWPAARGGTGKPSDGAWLVVGHSDDALVGALVAQLCAAGTPCTQVTPEALAGALPAARVVCVWGAPPDASADSAATAASDVEALRAQQIASEGLALVQCLAQQGTQTRVWLVTQGAVWVDGDRTTNVGQSTLWGLGRTVMQEHPELGCTLVDAPAGDAGEAASAVVRELGAGDDEREIAWRGGTRRVARLVRAAQDESAAWQAGDGAVLITGGLGALGMHVARWLAGRGVRHLVLTGRRGRQTPGAEAAIGELEGLGARVTVAAVDVADRAAMAGVVAEIGAGGALCGVVHAAGVLDDGVVGEQSAARFAGVLGPKLVGALHLDALTRGLALDFFVVFSSTAGTLGSAGQAPYAAASAGLDALAAGRRARGEAGQSLAWGAWSESGMAAQLSAMHQARIARQGIQAWTPAQGVAVLASVLGRPEPQLVLLPLDLSAARKALGANVPPVWRALVRPPRRAAARGGWADEIAALPAARRRAAIAEVVRQEIARVMALASETQVAEDRPLQDLGLDSLMAVELRNALGKRAGASLPATLAFDYPTPAAITGYLFDKVLSLGGAALTASAPSGNPTAPGLTIEAMSGLSDEQAMARLQRELSGALELP